MKSSCCCPMSKVVCFLVVVGAINWGLYGVFGVDLVAKLLGEMTLGARIAYGLVGVAGVLKVASCFIKCPCCKTGDQSKDECCKK